MKAKESKIKVNTISPFDGWLSHEGLKIWVEDRETNELHWGTVRIKAVRCGKKNCSKCPHKSYAYVQFRIGSKVTEKYLGVAR